jgi:hypothetical protein
MKYICALCFVVLIFPACHKGKTKRKACSYPATEARFGDAYLSIPNIFTPDGDGQFELWQFSHNGIASFSMRVEDGLGRNAFIWEDPDQVWEGLNKNGKELQGLFYYHVVAESNNGEILNAESYVAVVRDTDKLCLKNLDDCVFNSILVNDDIVETASSVLMRETYPCR